MSSSGPKTRRRLQNACLRCRQKKGDSGLMPNNICSGCITADVECTHSNLKKRRGPKRVPKDQSTKRFEATQTAISCILAEPDTYPFPEDPDEMRTLVIEISQYAYFLQKAGQPVKVVASPAGPPLSLTPSSARSSTPDTYTIPYLSDHPPRADDQDASTISDRLEELTLSQQSNRHYGPSSNFLLVQTLLDFKQEATGHKQNIDQGFRRPEFWCIYPWQEKSQNQNRTSTLRFPEEDLLHELIDAYFVHFEPFLPLLHRPTFEKSIAEGLHLRDRGFGQVVLGVCAVASRHSGDPRNMPEGTQSDHSLGWRWYSQISLDVSSFLEAPRLYDLQLCILIVVYLQASSVSESSWITLGIAMRLGQAVGLHRKQPDHPRTIKRELWIRVFWAIIACDTYASLFLGRPRVTTADDFDVEFPMDCDQEFWDNATSEDELLVQPSSEKPTRVTFWIYFLKLLEIAGSTHKLIYPIRRTGLNSTVLGQDRISWNRNAVMELDSALNAWVSSIPDYIRWDPKQSDRILLLQTAMLYCSYYWVQIQIHKKFIPGPGQEAVLNGFPSMAICANAARSTIRIFEVCKAGHSSPINLPSLFVSAIILLINFWRGKRSNAVMNTSAEMREVYKCFELIRPYEKRFQGAGRMIDILNKIISVGHLDIPFSPTTPAYERSPDPGSDISFEIAGYPSSSSFSRGSLNEAPRSFINHQPPLPFYANEIASLPHYSSTPAPSSLPHLQSIGAGTSYLRYDSANGLNFRSAMPQSPSEKPTNIRDSTNVNIDNHTGELRFQQGTVLPGTLDSGEVVKSYADVVY
ncbi:fungal-specific transcription factor domain-containing protein [Lentinula raphanica]|nr:fungal-specific transcription factor domain-containing protein [Lentinula raphanica]